MKTVWRDLNTDPPTGNEYAVLLFPCRSDCGVLYVVSNPHYARGEYAKQRYTHWAEFELAPSHDELVAWQDSLTSEDIEKSLDNIQWEKIGAELTEE